MTEYAYKLKNGKIVSAYADEKGNISITKETLEIMANSWNDGYQKGRADIIATAHCDDADCFECAFGSAEKCLLGKW